MKKTVIYHQNGKDRMYKTWHTSNRNMLIYMHSDGGSIVCNEKIYPIKKGVLCFIGAGKYHYTMPDNSDSYDRSKLFVTSRQLDRISKLFPHDVNFAKFSEGVLVYSVIKESEMPEADRLFEELQMHSDNDEYSDALIIAACIKLMVLISKNVPEKTEPHKGTMGRAVEYINSNIFRDIGIDNICDNVHMSKYYFCRRFKESTGMTVMNYILKTRIIMAQNLLLTEKISVTEVSSKCGFSSISYFCRVFKEETGKTPLEYRRFSEKK